MSPAWLVLVEASPERLGIAFSDIRRWLEVQAQAQVQQAHLQARQQPCLKTVLRTVRDSVITLYLLPFTLSCPVSKSSEKPAYLALDPLDKSLSQTLNSFQPRFPLPIAFHHGQSNQP